jgi:hypothetical protein
MNQFEKLRVVHLVEKPRATCAHMMLPRDRTQSTASSTVSLTGGLILPYHLHFRNQIPSVFQIFPLKVTSDEWLSEVVYVAVRDRQ